MTIEEFEDLPIRTQLAIIYELIVCDILPILGEEDE